MFDVISGYQDEWGANFVLGASQVTTAKEALFMVMSTQPSPYANAFWHVKKDGVDIDVDALEKIASAE
jgi:hypothetical protein